MYYGGMGYYGMDWTYILVLIGAAITMLASARVKGTFNRYAGVASACRLTGADVAKRILNSQGIYDVTVQPISGSLTDHYDPRTKTVNLSEPVYSSSSIAAIGVAAHECGHAIQDAREYVPLKMRAAFVPVANIGSKAAMPLIIIGALIGGLGSPIVEIGIIMFSMAVIFQLITLPVEFNASGRALKILGDSSILSQNEVHEAREVLGAAALTYVAGAAASIMQLLRLILIFGGGRRRND